VEDGGALVVGGGVALVEGGGDAVRVRVRVLVGAVEDGRGDVRDAVVAGLLRGGVLDVRTDERGGGVEGAFTAEVQPARASATSATAPPTRTARPPARQRRAGVTGRSAGRWSTAGC
jgi:hypothetical protein